MPSSLHDATPELERFGEELQEELKGFREGLGRENAESLIQRLQHLKARATETIAFLEGLEGVAGDRRV